MVIIMVESKTSPDTNPIWFRDFLEAQKSRSIFVSFFLEDSLRLNNHRVMRPAVWSPNNLKMDGWNANFLLGWPIFMGYLSFGECIKSSNLVIKLNMTLGYVAHWFWLFGVSFPPTNSGVESPFFFNAVTVTPTNSAKKNAIDPSSHFESMVSLVGLFDRKKNCPLYGQYKTWWPYQSRVDTLRHFIQA